MSVLLGWIRDFFLLIFFNRVRINVPRRIRVRVR